MTGPPHSKRPAPAPRRWRRGGIYPRQVEYIRAVEDAVQAHAAAFRQSAEVSVAMLLGDRGRERLIGALSRPEHSTRSTRVLTSSSRRSCWHVG